MNVEDRINRDADEFEAYIRLADGAEDLVFSTYAYVERSRELRHLAAAVAFLYKSSLHGSCPAAAPRSYITRDARRHIPGRYNSPRGMKPLNSMLRHTFNYFDNIQCRFNFDDLDARETEDSVVFKRARWLCATISEVFAILSEADLSRTKDSAAYRLFQYICDYCLVLPKTLAEERKASAAARAIEERDAMARLAEAKPVVEKAVVAAWDEDDARVRAEAEEARRRAAEKVAPAAVPVTEAVAVAAVAPEAVVAVVAAPLAPAPKPKNLSGWLKKK